MKSHIQKAIEQKEIQQPLPNTRILLAEDNPANQMVIKSILEIFKTKC